MSCIEDRIIYFNERKHMYQSDFSCSFFTAFSTRLFSVLRFESVIHEFDP